MLMIQHGTHSVVKKFPDWLKIMPKGIDFEVSRVQYFQSVAAKGGQPVNKLANLRIQPQNSYPGFVFLDPNPVTQISEGEIGPDQSSPEVSSKPNSSLTEAKNPMDPKYNVEGMGLKENVEGEGGGVVPEVDSQQVIVLDQAEADSGVPKPMVLLGFPSPENHELEFGEISLSKEEIWKCRAYMRKENIEEIKGTRGETEKLKGMVKMKERVDYFVEYPDAGEEDNDVQALVLHQREEVKLSLDLTNCLSLKRNRGAMEEVVPEEQTIEEDSCYKRKKVEEDLMISRTPLLSVVFECPTRVGHRHL